MWTSQQLKKGPHITENKMNHIISKEKKIVFLFYCSLSPKNTWKHIYVDCRYGNIVHTHINMYVVHLKKHIISTANVQYAHIGVSAFHVQTQ